MARRQVVQLQAELNTDEEFDRFLETPGLLVIDIYTDWCGPCTGMVNALRKIKMEQGGDTLMLAIARADTISYIHRFFKKSEPTWLFVTQGKAINIMFGSDCPKLIALILHELKNLGKPHELYNVAEMLPIEVEQDNIKNAAKRAKLQKELDEQERKKSEYLHFVTETIHENLPDVGITVFGPHINRDTFRHLLEYGPEKFGIVCKDRRFQAITKEQFDTINFFCKNPLPRDVIEAIEGKELSICFWKKSDETHVSIVDVLQKYADEIVKSHRLPPDEYNSEEQVIPPLATAAKVKVEFELPAGEECPVEVEQPKEEEQPKPKKPADAAHHDAAAHEPQKHEPTHDDAIGEEEDDEHEETQGEGTAEEPKAELTAMPDLDLDLDDGDSQSFGEEEEEVIDDTPKSNICTKTVTIPAVWVPKDWRTHAAGIYTLFHQQTAGFLPPDPVPEPPHVIMAFDSYKKKDLIDFAERYKEDVPLYGFFTSDQAEEAKLIASSKNTYARTSHAATDKLVFKVNKRTSHTMLSLATYGPTYVSPNTTVGAEEAKVFFPENYITAEQEMLVALQKQEKTDKRKSKRSIKSEQSRERLPSETLSGVATDVDEPVESAKPVEPTQALESQPAEGVAAVEAQAAGETPVAVEAQAAGETTAAIEAPAEGVAAHEEHATEGAAVTGEHVGESAEKPAVDGTQQAETAQSEQPVVAPTEEPAVAADTAQEAEPAVEAAPAPVPEPAAVPAAEPAPEPAPEPAAESA